MLRILRRARATRADPLASVPRRRREPCTIDSSRRERGRTAPIARRLALLAACFILIAAAGCGEQRGSRQISLHECRLPNLASAAQCGSVDVPEDRLRPGGRKLAIAVALLPANTLSPKADALFMLAGGPGQSGDALAPVAGALSAVRRNRDIVLIDQRGTGKSAPLECAALAPKDPFDDLTDPDGFANAVHHCLEQLQASGTVDVAQYTTPAFVADIDAVRAALGYQRINLWGGSYGTRAAQEYLRRYPEHVRSVVLDGVAPPGLRISLDVWASRDAAIGDVLAACAATAACQRAYPDLNATLTRISAQISAQTAAGQSVAIADPRTGVVHPVKPSFDMVIGALHGLVYVPELATMIPALLSRVEAGDYAPLAAAGMLFREDAVRSMSMPLHFAVTCAEDAPRISAAETRAIVPSLRAPELIERALAACAGWPRPPLPADFYAPLHSDKPVLLLSGGLDPVTPPADAALVASTLPNSRHIVAAGYGHIVSPHACAPRLIEAFIDTAGFATLPQSCIDYFAASKRPPLFTSTLEPR